MISAKLSITTNTILQVRFVFLREKLRAFVQKFYFAFTLKIYPLSPPPSDVGKAILLPHNAACVDFSRP